MFTGYISYVHLGNSQLPLNSKWTHQIFSLPVEQVGKRAALSTGSFLLLLAIKAQVYAAYCSIYAVYASKLSDMDQYSADRTGLL